MGIRGSWRRRSARGTKIIIFFALHEISVNHLSAKAFVALNVSSDVSAPRTISTSFIIGGGFMKCMPITCKGNNMLV